MESVTVNGRAYRLPARPVVVVCIDGSAPEYFDDGLRRGTLPRLARFRRAGFSALADCVIPSFTNPNNLSIVTGAPPAVHGISGNFFLDPDTGRETMMNDPALLRCDSVLAALARRGLRIAIVTAKDKLRLLLGHGVQPAPPDPRASTRHAVCFSAERAHDTSLAEHGIAHADEFVGRPAPDVYSAAASEFVMEAGVKLLETWRPDVMYLSLTDYIQHKHPPGDRAADAFYRRLDALWGRLAELGAVVGLTADHGMNGKTRADGQPDIVYLEPLLAQCLPAGGFRVILPITDPYVVHHGSLGSYATVYLRDGGTVSRARELLARERGIVYVEPRAAACERFGLPPDRVGDLVVISDRHVVLGKSPAAHDLSLLKEPLRSHGGLAEQRVPFEVSAPVSAAYRERARQGLRNFDIFDYVLNGVTP
ncbi:MAG: phosphonoacetate hydrolase [SAR324 cluster bacterium]